MKVLKDILAHIEAKEVIGEHYCEIEHICFDSREVSANTLFVAIIGGSVDGHNYIDIAIKQGARAIICHVLPRDIEPTVTYVVVDDSTATLADLASFFYGHPSRELTLVGVTGTNGKTTIATLLYDLFTSLGNKVGLLSTVKIRVGEDSYDATHTTPDSLTINRYLRLMVEQGCSYCFMEVSSHGIIQNRTRALDFDGGVFTNLTHDHLDYHINFSNYRDAKKRFFDHLNKKSFALINVDDKNAMIMVQNTRAKIRSYALKNVSDYKAVVLESQFSGMLLRINQQEVWVQLIGHFNASNLLAVYSVAIELGIETSVALLELSKLTSVQGRFQYTISSNNVTAIVDYAHTPDALKNVLDTINSIRTHNEQLYTVVGCGGNRDKTKRPEMAHIATQLSDKVILTSDNPRFEDPSEILKDMEMGVEGQYTMKTIVVEDRRQAIKLACQQALAGDIILIAGKGHETYQEVKGERSHFNDLEIVTEFLQN